MTDAGPTNLPGQAALHWRTTAHGASLARMRASLAERHRPGAYHDTDDAAVALLDAWAVMTDVVSFYTERIAQECFLRTATEPVSVRWLARMVGYEPRPGVSAEADLVFEADTTTAEPTTAVVPAGTPVQTLPTPGALPQTFETDEELIAYSAWNAIPAFARRQQKLTAGDKPAVVWANTTAVALKRGDRLLLVQGKQWDFQAVASVEVGSRSDPTRAWTRVTLNGMVEWKDSAPSEPGGASLGAQSTDGGLRVYRLARRYNVVGWNGPAQRILLRDPTEFVGIPSLRQRATKDGSPAGSWAPSRRFDVTASLAPGVKPDGSVGAYPLSLDGDHPEILANSLLVVENTGSNVPVSVRIESVGPGGQVGDKYSTKATILRVDREISGIDPHTALVHGMSEELPASWMPDDTPLVSGIELVRTDPPLAAGRRVMITGRAAADAPSATETAWVQEVELREESQMVTLAKDLKNTYLPGTAVVHGNVAQATHGETVSQVLGSGDGGAEFQSFPLRRSPLSYLRTSSHAMGARAALGVRVDDVGWTEVPTFAGSGPTDRVYLVRHQDDGTATITFGDGRHGARLPTGVENVHARYRVGVGASGEAAPNQISLPTRRPSGIMAVRNPAASQGAAEPDEVERARLNAPQRIQTLDRVVSVADFEDFARGYTGVGQACADLVWDGRAETVVLSVMDAAGRPGSATLLEGLRGALDGACEFRAPHVVLAGEAVDAMARLSLSVDPHYQPGTVVGEVEAGLLQRFGMLEPGIPMISSSLLVVAAETPGVISATMPVLSRADASAVLFSVTSKWPAAFSRPRSPRRRPAPDGAASTTTTIAAERARWEESDQSGQLARLRPAQALRLTKVVVTP